MSTVLHDDAAPTGSTVAQDDEESGVGHDGKPTAAARLRLAADALALHISPRPEYAVEPGPSPRTHRGRDSAGAPCFPKATGARLASNQHCATGIIVTYGRVVRHYQNGHISQVKATIGADAPACSMLPYTCASTASILPSMLTYCLVMTRRVKD